MYINYYYELRSIICVLHPNIKFYILSITYHTINHHFQPLPRVLRYYRIKLLNLNS